MGGSLAATTAPAGAEGRAVARRSARARSHAAALALPLLLVAPSCALMPGELNLSPLYHHRLDPDGSVRRMDVLWPIFHYNKTEDGGYDFRIRPFYRYVARGEGQKDLTNPHTLVEPGSTEHQFLWPLGRVYNRRDETLARLFPLFRYGDRSNDEGEREVDWNVLLLAWGGTRDNGKKPYFGLLPFYADLPDFLTYDRFRTHLFPFHVALDKGDQHSEIFLWPLVGFSSNEDGSKHWQRVLPFYSASVEAERFERYSALWPFVHWGYEGYDRTSPIENFFLFPFFGRQTAEDVDSWTVLWPFFQKAEIENRLLKVDVLWPIFRYYRDTSEHTPIEQWWIWPLCGHTVTDDQRAWSVAWPLMWFREYDDPDGTQKQDWVLPFYWRVHRDRVDGTEDDYLEIWPLWHRQRDHDGTGHWALLSPWPWRGGNADSVQAHYGWLWTLAEGETTPHGSTTDLAANLFTTSERDGRRQTSVPLLFNYESDADGAVLRLFQFLPIPLGGPAEPTEKE